MDVRAKSCKWLIMLAIVVIAAAPVWAAQWTVLGPDGGDVRSLTYDPKNPDRIYLGTSTGTIFVSQDAGHNWSRLAHLGEGDDFVLDHIAVDPQNPSNIYAAAWSVENQQAGDLFRSHDGGKSWESLRGMHGKSVRALAIAASDPRYLVAGALDGVYRSRDGGSNWERMSPLSASEIRNIESIAVDPKDPNVVYAGTWHLAWKTPDGGLNWEHINKGMIEDSDVFSIIVDSSNPAVVFASACSGIYKSEVAGELFHKIQGIPFSARRTRVLKQDPGNPAIVYAGTTEGLWKSSDSGKTWKQVSKPDVVVNDVLVDPRDSRRVLLATDRSGVLASDDGAQNFAMSNHGYSHRYVTSILAGASEPNSLFVSVVNDREFGGVFASRDGGQHWSQTSTGLGGRDVFSLQQSPSGTLIAGTNRGIFLLDRSSSAWRPSNSVTMETTSIRTVKRGKKSVKVVSRSVKRSVLEARVNEIQVTPSLWLAATSAGLFSSANEGKSWTGGPVLGKLEIVSAQASKGLTVAATRMNVFMSSNAGETWSQAALPSYLTIRSVTLTPEGQILVAAREGAYRSPDSGVTWEHAVNGLPDKNISSISYDAASRRLFATSTATGVIFVSEDGGHAWKRGPDAGYPLRRISLIHGHFVAATPFDGLISQPEGESRNSSAELGGSAN